VVARRLRAVTAIFRTATGLDREQGADLHFGRVEVRTMHAAGAVQQFREGQVEKRADFLAAPVVAQGGGGGRGSTDGRHGSFPTDVDRPGRQSGNHGQRCQPKGTASG
jgi:hypothetical protein